MTLQLPEAIIQKISQQVDASSNDIMQFLARLVHFRTPSQVKLSFAAAIVSRIRWAASV